MNDKQIMITSLFKSLRFKSASFKFKSSSRSVAMHSLRVRVEYSYSVGQP